MTEPDPRTRESVAAAFAPLIDTLRTWVGAPPAGLVVGLCGAQGSGKSTLAAAAADLLGREGLKVAVLSLDDLYLPREARARLAREVSPLFAVRGPPGTHDVELGERVLASLARPGPTPMPRFDKATDDPRRSAEWTLFEGPADLVLFEGWCVGAMPQPEEALADPINTLEREEDADGRWRRAANARLAGDYRRLFRRLDRLVLLQAPGFEVVARWRGEQEEALRHALAPAGDRAGEAMSPDAIRRFVAHYERLTRWILAEMPGRANLTIPLDALRRPSRPSTFDLPAQ